MELNDLLPYLIACCVVPVILLVIVSVYVIRRGQRLITPDIDSLRRSFDHLKARNPDVPVNRLVNEIIHRQALRSGFVGAITSAGGIFLLPFGLTIDLYASARIQNTMLHFIAWAYDSAGTKEVQGVLGLNDALALRGEAMARDFVVARGGRAARYLYRELLSIIAQKTFAKLIPGIGLIIGFLVNYTITQGMGRLAARWYTGELVKGVKRPAVSGGS